MRATTLTPPLQIHGDETGDELGCGPLNTQYTAHAGFVGVVLHVNIRKVMFGVRDVKTPPH